MKLKKSMTCALIVLAGIAVSLLIGIPAKKLGWSFLEQLSIIGPAAGIGYAIECYLYGAKRHTGFKEWAVFIVSILLVTAAFWGVKEYVF